MDQNEHLKEIALQLQRIGTVDQNEHLKEIALQLQRIGTQFSELARVMSQSADAVNKMAQTLKEDPKE